MVEILNFKPPETAFDPEAISVLASALDEAWGRIQQSGSQFARPAYSQVMREVVAKRIMEMAQRGVKDQQTLVDDAVRFLFANYKEFGRSPL
jgi:hypothetical protein